jgi:hypothetical protein
MARAPKGPKQVETLTHDEATRRNIPTAELQSTAEYLEERRPPQPAHYPRARPLAAGEGRKLGSPDKAWFADLDYEFFIMDALNMLAAPVGKLAEMGIYAVSPKAEANRSLLANPGSDLVPPAEDRP